MLKKVNFFISESAIQIDIRNVLFLENTF